MTAHILVLDIAGNPFDWIPPQDAIHYYAIGKVAWELGARDFVFRGGYAKTGIQSRIVVKPIIAIAGSEIMARKFRPVVQARSIHLRLLRQEVCAPPFVARSYSTARPRWERLLDELRDRMQTMQPGKGSPPGARFPTPDLCTVCALSLRAFHPQRTQCAGRPARLSGGQAAASQPHVLSRRFPIFSFVFPQGQSRQVFAALPDAVPERRDRIEFKLYVNAIA